MDRREFLKMTGLAALAAPFIKVDLWSEDPAVIPATTDDVLKYATFNQQLGTTGRKAFFKGVGSMSVSAEHPWHDAQVYKLTLKELHDDVLHFCEEAWDKHRYVLAPVPLRIHQGTTYMRPKDDDNYVRMPDDHYGGESWPYVAWTGYFVPAQRKTRSPYEDFFREWHNAMQPQMAGMWNKYKLNV